MPAQATFHKIINAPTAATAVNDAVYFYKDFCGIHIVVTSTPASGAIQLHEIRDYRSVKGNLTISRNADGKITQIDNGLTTKIYAYHPTTGDMTTITEVYKGLSINYTVSKTVSFTNSFLSSILVA